MSSMPVFRMRNALVALLLFMFFANMVFASDAFSAYRSSSGSGANFPKVRFWNSSGSGSWGSEVELPTAGSPVREAVIKQSPVSRKIVLVTESDDGYLDAYVCGQNCGSSSSWVVSNNIGSVWSSAPAISSRRFDVEFESSTGKAVVVYGFNASNGSNDLAYKILPPNTLNFSGITEQYINDNTDAGAVQYSWISLDRKPISSSSELALVGFDTSSSPNNDINAWIWNGSVWGNQVEVSGAASSTGGYEALAVRYSADGSKGMAIGATGNSGDVNGQYWNGASWTTANIGDMSTGNADVQWLTLKADPATDDLQTVAVETGPNLYSAYWSGSAWTIAAVIDSGIDTAATRPADFEWNVTGSRGVLVWDTDTTGSTMRQLLCAPQCTGTNSTISTYYGGGNWTSLYRNPTSTDTVKILGGRMNNSNSLGSFYYDGSGYTNYADNALSSNVGSALYEAFTFAFQLNSSAFDFTSPIVALNAPSNSTLFASTTVDLNFTATDDNSTSMNCSLYLDGVLNMTNASVQNNTLTNFQRTGLGNGNHVWYVKCADAANNTNSSETRNFTVDSIAPTVTPNLPIDGLNTSATTLNFNFTATDNLATVMSCALFIDGTVNNTNASVQNNTLTNFQVAGFAQGYHNWSVSCNDTANNTGSSGVRYFTVDTTNPSVSPNSPADLASTGANVNFNFTATDNLATAMNCSLYIDSALNKTNSSTQNNTATILAGTGLAGGSHTWYVTCVDGAGNSGSSTTRTINVDGSPPAVTPNAPVNGLNTSTPTLNFNFTATDNAATVMSCALLIDGATSATNASTQNNTLTNFLIGPIAQGYHNWTIACNDTYNNTGTSASRNFTVDTAAPTVTQNAPVNGFNTTSSTINFNFTAIDNLASTMSCALYIDGAVSATNAFVPNNTLFNIAIGSFSQGLHNWSVSCNDSVPNTGSSAVRNFTVDTAAPVVSLTSPAAGASIANSTVNFIFSATDNLATVMNCSLYIDGAYNRSNATTQNSTVTNFTVTGLGFGLHTWNITCKDPSGNIGNANRSFTDTAVTT
jgi:hypothetical protein